MKFDGGHKSIDYGQIIEDLFIYLDDETLRLSSLIRENTGLKHVHLWGERHMAVGMRLKLFELLGEQKDKEIERIFIKQK